MSRIPWVCCACMRRVDAGLVRHMGCPHEGCDKCMKERRPKVDKKAEEPYRSMFGDFLGDYDEGYLFLLGDYKNGEFIPTVWN